LLVQKIAFLFASCHEILIINSSRQLEPMWLKIFKLLEGARRYIKPVVTATDDGTNSGDSTSRSSNQLPRPGLCVYSARLFWWSGLQCSSLLVVRFRV
jgi:hypothetical protein